jgi:hypothetical protein
VIRKYSSRYWDTLFNSRKYGQLVELSGALCCSTVFEQADTKYGLPSAAFMFVEDLLWFAQGNRSGVWTYFDATPALRQSAMLNALENGGAPPEFALHYALCMQNRTSPDVVARVDAWIRAHDQENNDWLWRVAQENRALFENICG